MTNSQQITALERLIADSAQPEKVKRACSLRLSRLRRAGALPQRQGAAPMAKTPPAPTEKQCLEAAESFLALSRQRSALHRKRRRTASEFLILGTMAALMPAGIPQTDDPTEWRNFVARVEGLLSEIKNSNL